MITYQQRQVELIEQMQEQFRQGQSPSTLVDPVQDYEHDQRICLTSVVLLPEDISQEIRTKLIEPLQVLDPRQFFYPEFHLTIQNIRTISQPPLFTQEDIAKVIEVFQAITPKYHRFTFELKNLLILPNNVGMCGYCDETLRDLCLDLRQNLIDVGVPDDKSYASPDILFGVSNFCRYTTPPNVEFLAKLEELKQVSLPDLEVQTISLVTGNAVLHPSSLNVIQQFDLA
jgi:hypothetical protein